MSSVVKTNTMFVDSECLIDAIKSTGILVTEQSENRIVTSRVDYYGAETFVFENGRFVFMHDSTANRMGNRYPWNRSNLKEWKDVGVWLKDVGIAYDKAYKAKLERLAEEERCREEERLRKLVESRTNEIVAKAEEEGYYVKKSERDGKIKLVLVRSVY